MHLRQLSVPTFYDAKSDSIRLLAISCRVISGRPNTG